MSEKNILRCDSNSENQIMPQRNFSGMACKRRKGSAKIVLPTGEPDGEAMRSFMRTCLVPVLAEEFLRQRAKKQMLKTEAKGQDSTTGLLGRKDGR